MDDLKKFYYQEHKHLREELNNLKSCQVTFFTTTVTATGLILTVAAKISPPTTSLGYLLPLTILIPSCVIFFDKAQSISRIVGYYRILEKFIIKDNCDWHFIGWESALKLFRSQDRKIICKDKGRSSPGWYLLLIYFCYLFLALFCIILYLLTQYPNLSLANFYRKVGSDYIFIVISLIFLVSYIYNSIILFKLTSGNYSYDCNELVWKNVFTDYKKGKKG